MQDPISSDVRPSPENNDRCAMRNGNSVSGTTEFPDESLTVSRAIIGGVNGRRDRLAIPNSAVRRGCCTTSSSYVRALLKGSTNNEATRILGWGRASESGDEAGRSVMEFRLEGGVRLELEAAENIEEAKEG